MAARSVRTQPARDVSADRRIGVHGTTTAKLIDYIVDREGAIRPNNARDRSQDLFPPGSHALRMVRHGRAIKTPVLTLTPSSVNTLIRVCSSLDSLSRWCAS